jgi:hypothetical protein
MIKKNTLITYAGLGLFGVFGPITFPRLYIVHRISLDDGLNGFHLGYSGRPDGL